MIYSRWKRDTKLDFEDETNEAFKGQVRVPMKVRVTNHVKTFNGENTKFCHIKSSALKNNVSSSRMK